MVEIMCHVLPFSMENIAKTLLSILCLRWMVDIVDRDHELPSSINAVESSDDLLTEILLRLPVSSLYVFKFVSKRWLSLITRCNFNLRRSQIPKLEPPIGLFILRYPIAEYDFVSFDRRIPSKRSSIHATLIKHTGLPSMILDSCNGLLICRTESSRLLFVYNPYTDVFKMLPEFGDFRYAYTRMAFDPTKSPHYKVVEIGYIVDQDYPIHIYSSETGNWSAYSHPFSLDKFVGFRQGILWNNAIHWTAMSLHCRLDIAEDRPLITETQLPDFVSGKYRVFKLFESTGCLLLLCRKHLYSRHFSIFEMRNGNSVWSPKYVLKVPFPEIRSPITTRVRSVVLGDRKEDSCIVIELSGKVVEFKFLVNKTLRKLYDLGSTNGHLSSDIYPPARYQLIALSTASI